MNFLPFFKTIKTFQKNNTGKPIPYKIVPRRPGDIASCYCDPSKARELLGWEAKRGVEAMCADSWHWQSNNRNGYTPPPAN